MAMPAWFNLRPLDQPKDEAGIKSAAAAINEIIQSEVVDLTKICTIALNCYKSHKS